MKHPFEIISLANYAKYKKPRKILDEEYITNQENVKIQPYINSVNNLNKEVEKLNQQLKPLQQEYDREMNYRTEMAQILETKEKRFFKKRKH